MQSIVVLFIGVNIMIGGIIDSVFNIATDRRDYNRSVSQYKDQYQLQKEQFYNPMQVRVEDLKKAGLHPTLAAGMTSGQVVSAPQHQSSGKQTNFAGIEFQKAQMDQIQAQTDLLKAQAEDIRSNTPIQGQVSTAPQSEALGTKKLIENALDPMSKAVAEKTGYKKQLPEEASLFWSPAEMAEARVRYGDEPVEWFMGLPNMARDALFHKFIKYGKGRTLSEFIAHQASIHSPAYKFYLKHKYGDTSPKKNLKKGFLPRRKKEY